MIAVFCATKGFQVFFHTPPPPLAYTTLDFAELIVGSVDISHWIIQNPHNLVSKAWVDNNERFLHHNPCTQSSNVHFSDFISNSSQNMRQKKTWGTGKVAKGTKEIIHRWDGLDGLVSSIPSGHLYLWCIHT
jgi:hypothetical protein